MLALTFIDKIMQGRRDQSALTIASCASKQMASVQAAEKLASVPKLKWMTEEPVMRVPTE